MKNYIKIILLLLPILTIFFVSNIHAQTPTDKGITLSPVISNVTLNKGETYNGKLYITYNNNTVANANILVYAFRQSGDTQHPKFSNKINKLSQSIHWIKIQKNVTLYPHKTIIINYTLNVAKNASPGGHFLSIIVSITKAGNEKIVESVGSLLIITINGRIISSGYIQNFGATNKVFFQNPINLYLKFVNTGNIQLAPYGYITISNIFGNKIKIIEINKNQSLDLPKSTRLYTTNFSLQNFINQFGIYTATLNLTYGYQGHFVNTQSSSTFYYFNYIYLIVLILIIIAILLYVIKRKHNNKSLFQKKW
jgi:hypothetical protein